MRHHVVVAAVVLVAAACVRTNAVMLGTATTLRPAVAVDSVRVYRTADQIAGRYEEIALLNAAADASWTDEAKMVNAMRKKAARLGANAVILDSMSEPSAGAKVAGAILGTGAERKGKAIAVYVFPDATSSPDSTGAMR